MPINEWGNCERQTDSLSSSLEALKNSVTVSLSRTVRLLHNSMVAYSIENEAIEYGDKRYYIAYSYEDNGYIVEHRHNRQTPNIVCFGSEEVAYNCIKTYQPLMDKVRHLEKVRDMIHYNKEATQKDINRYNKLVEGLI